MRLNLFTNPTFEAGLGLWTATGGGLTWGTGGGFSGNRFLSFTGSGSRGRVTPGERMTVTAGGTYTLSAYFRIPATLSTPHYLSVEFYAGASLKGQAGIGAFPLQNALADWTRTTLSFTVPADATEVLVYGPQAAVGTVSANTDVIHADAFLLEPGDTAQAYFDGSYDGYQWDGASNASPSRTATSVQPAESCILEIETSEGTWLNVTGPTRAINISRHDSDPGSMSAEVLDATLDPTQAGGLHPGRPVRVRVIDATGSTHDVYTGKLDTIEVAYDPLAKAGRTANVKLTAVDCVSFLANQPEKRGVGTIDELRWLVTGVPFKINGATTGTGSGTVVANNDGASLWDQVLITRDSRLGYAWVDRSNVLNVYDNAVMDTSSKATIGPDVYSALDHNFDASQIINTVTVQWLRYDIGTEQSTTVQYGPYVDDDSVAEWGTRSATFTVQGATEVEADIEAYANEVLARNSTAEVRPKSASIPMRHLPDLRYVRDIDLNSRVLVVYHDGTTAKEMRVTGISHTITPSKWILDLEFALPLGVTAPSQTATPPPPIPPDSVGDDELDDDVLQSIEDALAAADAAQVFAETKAQTYRQPTVPTSGSRGDLWFDTDDGNKLYVHDGTSFVVATSSYLTTPNGQLKIEPGGLFGYDGSGTLKVSIDAGTGALYTAGAVISGGDVGGATVTGGTIQTDSSVTPNRTGVKLSNTGIAAYDPVTHAPVLEFLTSTGALIIKGSIQSGSTITGATVTGGTVQTGTSGQRVVMSSAGTITFYDSGGNSIPVYGSGAGLLVFGKAQVWSDLHVSQNLSVDGSANLSSANVSGVITGSRVNGGDVYVTNTPSESGTGLGAVYMGNTGRLRLSSSAAKYKTNIKPLDIDPDTFLALQPVTYDPIDGEDVAPTVGFIADQADELGFTHLVGYRDGEVETLHYERVSAYQQVALREHNRLIAAMLERIEALEQQVSALAA